MIKVMIADDQALIRESLQIILSVYADIDVVSVVGDGIEAMDNIMTVKPDIKKRFPNIKIIILTTFDDDEFIFSALKYGASGYLLKGVSTDELYQAIQTVYKGGAMINPNIASKVFQLFSQMAQTNFSITVKEENIENISQNGKLFSKWHLENQIRKLPVIFFYPREQCAITFLSFFQN